MCQQRQEIRHTDVAIAVSVRFAFSEAPQREIADLARAETDERAAELEMVVDFQDSMLSDVDPEAMGLSIVANLRQRAIGWLGEASNSACTSCRYRMGTGHCAPGAQCWRQAWSPLLAPCLSRGIQCRAEFRSLPELQVSRKGSRDIH